MKTILVTAALPYANGSIHLGHILEQIQADVFSRAARVAGNDVIFACADDVHGTGVEIAAMKEGITVEELVERSSAEHVRDFKGFKISHDIYTSTDTPQNKALAERIYKALRDGGHIETRTIEQMYSPALGRFLNDRLVKGTCPKCGAQDQYGDVCESCGTTYSPTDLIDPVDAVHGETPELRTTEHLYVGLSAFSDMLRDWIVDGVPQDSVKNYIEGWLAGGLEDWCISRDEPYFGFPIPDMPGKYFYVWLDAPVGYIAATQEYCDSRGRDWRDIWAADSDAEIVHFIGKDIVYFHTLFWPAMLHVAGLSTPSKVQVHGMVTVDGKKMSKSRGTFVNASEYLEHLDPDYLRFYFASRLSTSLEDVDLNWEQFVTHCNSELVNNLVNLCSRVTKFISSRLSGEPLLLPLEHELLDKVDHSISVIEGAFRRSDHRLAIRQTLELGDAANNYFQSSEPWALMKTDKEQAAEVCALTLHVCHALMTALYPVTPGLAERFATIFALPAEELYTWDKVRERWLPSELVPVQRLMERLEMKDVESLTKASEQAAAAGEAEELEEAPDDALRLDDFGDEITFDDFSKVDLRVGVVRSAELVEGADKLLRLKVDCGRVIQVFAGVRSAYPEPEVLVGRRVIVVANLKPRKMRFGVSEGMLLATSAPDNEGLQLVHPDNSALGGWTVR